MDKFKVIKSVEDSIESISYVGSAMMVCADALKDGDELTIANAVKTLSLLHRSLAMVQSGLWEIVNNVDGRKGI